LRQLDFNRDWDIGQPCVNQPATARA
jgi:hypothetical protein